MRSEEENFLDGCRHVFLDMGTNTGVQIRKLYEPHLFPNASVLPIFDKFFGPIGERLWRGSEPKYFWLFQGPPEHLHSWVWTKCYAQWRVGQTGREIPRLRLAGWLSKSPIVVVFRFILLLPLVLGLRRNLIWSLFIKRFEDKTVSPFLKGYFKTLSKHLLLSILINFHQCWSIFMVIRDIVVTMVIIVISILNCQSHISKLF